MKKKNFKIDFLLIIIVILFFTFLNIAILESFKYVEEKHNELSNEILEWEFESPMTFGYVCDMDFMISEEEHVIVMKPAVDVSEMEATTEVEFESLSFIPVEIQKLCFEIGQEYHIAPELLIAIIEAESSGDVMAVNKKTGCMGLMQLHPKYADYYLGQAGCSDPFIAEHNIRAGCEILLEKFQQYESTELVLMKYHGEKDAYKRFNSGNYSSYCKRIMKRFEEMQEM